MDVVSRGLRYLVILLAHAVIWHLVARLLYRLPLPVDLLLGVLAVAAIIAWQRRPSRSGGGRGGWGGGRWG